MCEGCGGWSFSGPALWTFLQWQAQLSPQPHREGRCRGRPRGREALPQYQGKGFKTGEEAEGK